MAATARSSVTGKINYFSTNQERMDYPQYRAVGLPIGSGVVESACKNVVGARMKQSGMMWTLEGARDMLQLRAAVKSRRFWSDFENLLPRLPHSRPTRPTGRLPNGYHTKGMHPTLSLSSTYLLRAFCKIPRQRN